MFCIHCGNKLPDDARFCPVCGNEIGAISEKLDVFELPENTGDQPLDDKQEDGNEFDCVEGYEDESEESSALTTETLGQRLNWKGGSSLTQWLAWIVLILLLIIVVAFSILGSPFSEEKGKENVETNVKGAEEKGIDFSWVEGKYSSADYYLSGNRDLYLYLWFDQDAPWKISENWFVNFKTYSVDSVWSDSVSDFVPFEFTENQAILYYEGETDGKHWFSGHDEQNGYEELIYIACDQEYFWVYFNGKDEYTYVFDAGSRAPLDGKIEEDYNDNTTNWLSDFEKKQQAELNTRNYLSIASLVRNPYDFIDGNLYRISGEVAYIEKGNEETRGLIRTKDSSVCIGFAYPGWVDAVVGDEIIVWGQITGTASYTENSNSVVSANLYAEMWRVGRGTLETAFSYEEWEFIFGCYQSDEWTRAIEEEIVLTEDAINGRPYTVISCGYSAGTMYYSNDQGGEELALTIQTETIDNGKQEQITFLFDFDGMVTVGGFRWAESVLTSYSYDYYRVADEWNVDDSYYYKETVEEDYDPYAKYYDENDQFVQDFFFNYDSVWHDPTGHYKSDSGGWVTISYYNDKYHLLFEDKSHIPFDLELNEVVSYHNEYLFVDENDEWLMIYALDGCIYVSAPEGFHGHTNEEISGYYDGL